MKEPRKHPRDNSDEPDSGPLNKISRRRFIAATAAGIGMPMIIPASALGKGKRPAPSSRLNVACLGFGTIAYNTTSSFLRNDRVQVIAVADVNRRSGNYGYEGEKEGGREVGREIINKHYAEATGKGSYDGCNIYEDFRQLLAKEDIDAVNISTPDHWHAVMAIYCAKKRKHIYGQKPLALTIDEGRKMVKAIRRYKVTWQTGSQQRSATYFREAVEFIRNGRIGKLKGIEVNLPGGHTDWNQMGSRKSPEPVPEGLNYDFWEGPAPHRDYRPALLPLNWRHNFDYSGGMVTDWGAHHIDIVQWALDMDRSGPVLIDNLKADLPPENDIFNTASSFNFDFTYANGVKVSVNGKYKNKNGITFKGEGGRSIYVNRNTIKMNPPHLRRDRIRDDEKRVYQSTDHVGNFVNCIYTGERTAGPIEAAHRTIAVCHLANIAIRLGRDSLKWDPKRERIIGDREASSMLKRPLRGRWKLS